MPVADDEIRLRMLTEEEADKLLRGMVAMREELNLDPPTMDEIRALFEWAESVLTGHGLLENVWDGGMWADWHHGKGATFRVTKEGKAKVEAQAAEVGGIDNLMREHGLDPDRARHAEKPKGRLQ